MGNSQGRNVRDERDQSLLSNNQNESDLQMSIGQPLTKNTMAIKNPFILKKESLIIDRDSTERQYYYIKFKYDSLIDFKFNVIFKAKEVKNSKETLYVPASENKNLNRNLEENNTYEETKQKEEDDIIEENKKESKIVVSDNIEEKIDSLSFICQKGFELEFDDPTCKINSDYFKKSDSNYVKNHEYDLVLEFLPLDSSISSEPLGFYTICSITEEKITDTTKIYKLKIESQILRAQGFIMELNEVYLAHRDQGECLICYEKLANTVLLPCRHSCCSSCAHGLRLRNLSCPMCKNSKF